MAENYSVCKVCFNRTGGQDIALSRNTCFSSVEHTNKERIQVTIVRGSPGGSVGSRLVPVQAPPNPPLLPTPQSSYLGWHRPQGMPSNHAYVPSLYHPHYRHHPFRQLHPPPEYSLMNPFAQPFVPPHQNQPMAVGNIVHNSPQIISSTRILSSSATQGHERQYARKSNFGTYEERKANPPPQSDTQLPLTLDNYRRKFKALLYYEEEEHISLLAKNCNGHYQISLMDQQQCEYQDGDFDSYFCVHGLSPNQILYASQASSEAHIYCSPYRSVRGKILRNYEHDSDMLCIGMNGLSAQNLAEKLPEKDTLEVKFEVKHSYFDSLHRSLTQISKEALRRIIPSAEDFHEGLKPLPRSNFPVNELDVFQSNALQTMAFSKSTAPVLIPGPFGSGKTRLLAVAAQYFSAIEVNKKSRILLCCCQQDSADIFMRDYFLKMLKDGWNVEVVRIASEVHRRGQLSHHVILLNRLNEKIDYYRSVNHLLVITTFMTALRLPDFFPQGFFTHILIDEGAQAREPECIAPLSMANKVTRIIVAGDSKQVGPKLVVLGKIANENGLGVSLVERLHKSYAEIELAKYYTVMLHNNYRCLPEILDLPSSLFYESSLNACAKVPRIKSYPLKFMCSSNSDYPAICENMTEAKIIIQEVETLINIDHVDTTGICIMSPSQRQVSLIREQLRYKRIRGIKVLSSYQMQGQEFDVLFLSTVEYVLSDGKPFDPLKSLCQPAVFNTAITRARSLVVAVGNPSTLMKAEEAMGSSFGCWKHFIARCKANGTYIEQASKDTSSISRNRVTLDDIAVVKKSSDKLTNKSRDDSCASGLDVTQPFSFSSYSKKKEANSRSVSSEVKMISKEISVQNSKSPDVPIASPNVSIAKSLSSHQCVVRNYTRRKPKRSRFDGTTRKAPSQTEQVFVNTYDKDFPTLEESMESPKAKPKKVIKNAKPTITDPQQVSRIQQDFSPDALKSALTSQNYKERFYHLLALEEKEHERILLNKCDGLYTFHVLTAQSSAKFKLKERRDDHIRLGFITANHLDGDKISYAKQASGRIVTVTLVNSHKKQKDIFELSIVGTEFAKGYEKIFLGLGIGDVLLLERCLPSMKKSDTQCEATVKFEFKHSYFDRLNRGIDCLSDEVITSKLIPKNHFNFSANDYGQQSTNMDNCVKEFVHLERGENMPHNPQMYALHRILNCDSFKAPILIIGSFGTGKTRLLVRAAYQILRNDRRAKVLVCAHHQKSVDVMLENYFGEMIEAGWNFTGCLIRLIPSEGHYECNPRYSMYYQTINELKENFEKKNIRLVLTTFSSSLLLYNYMRRDFTHILIDEGAQSREPESIIPLCLASMRTKIVIAGDHMQVGPAALVLGEEARENGLKVSLLERLHSLYSRKELSDVADSHCVTLLTNFRSHHALLSLPSYLFYGSALVTVAEATAQLHPDAYYPLHFVCSSLDEETVEVTDSYNLTEVVKILQEVRKYVNKWPEDIWGQKNLKQICIMATTANQKSHFLGELKSWYNRDIKGVEVLTVYDIQGQEFQAVFLSTAEPTYQNGMSKNPTKSPCGQYVFNTALTRAKSLFVCIGNPFLLLKVEEKMQNERRFWKDFMKRCIISKTFHVHEADLCGKLITEVYKSLQMLIFSKNTNSSYIEENLVNNYDDPIIKRLQEFVRRRPQFRRCKLQIYEQQSEQIWDIVTVKEGRNHEEKLNFIEKIECQLLITSPRNALGVPISSKEDPIVINGLKNRRGAFHGDIVIIGVLGKHEKTGKKYGKVINLKEGRHPTKYVCIADKQSIINFYPLDKLEPPIVNLPKISSYNLQYKREVFEQSQRSYVTVFEESSLNLQGDILPIVKELIPLEMCSSLLFVVKVLSWSPEFRKPLGAVIDALPRTNSIFIMEKLLTIAHDIHDNDNIELEVESYDDVDPSVSPSLLMYEYAFTIDPPTAVNLDDALSVMYLNENTLQVSVLITDVAKIIKQNSKLDNLAKQRGTSVYGLECAAHMLPVGLTKSKLSLLPEQYRNVIAVSAIVSLEDKKIVKIDGTSKPPEKAQMRSFARLTYEDAQRIMNDEEVALLNEKQEQFDSNNSLKLKDTLKMLFDIAMKLRIDRVGDAAYCNDASEPDEEKNWQSHLLVSELMIWANEKIAKFLYDNIPDVSIFRRQVRPLLQDVEKIEQTYKDAFMYSLSLIPHSVPNDEPFTEQLLIPLSVCVALKDAFSQRDLTTLRNLLSDNSNYPQLAIAQLAIRSISQRAEYIKGDSQKKEDNTDMFYGHHGLGVRYYTHFTSPIRRYPDILIQRLVNALINKSEIFYTESELQKLCTYLNKKLRSASKFEKDIKKLDLASSCENSLDKLQVYLAKSLHKQHKFEVCIPSIKYRGVVLTEDTHFDQSQLNCLQRRDSYITWRVVSVPFKSPDFLFHPQISNFSKCSKSESVSTTDQLVHASIFNIVEGDEDNDSYFQRRKKMSYMAEIQDEVLRIDLDEWKLCNEFVKRYTLESDPACLGMLEQLQLLVNRPDATSPEVLPEFLQSPVICYDTTRNFSNGETVNVWMGKSMKNPISSPGIHLIEVAPSVKVCLQHNKSPAMCFSDIQLHLTSKSSYDSKSEYVNLWCKALLAEASHDAVNTKSLVLLKDVPLIWPELIRPDNCLDNVYFKPNGDLKLSIDKEKLGILDFVLKVKIRPGDLVCARYSAHVEEQDSPSKELYAVYHFVIQKVEEAKKDSSKTVLLMRPKDDSKTVFMRPVGEHGCRVSLPWMKILKSNPPPCELQIIKMPDSFNRLFRRIVSMDNEDKEKQKTFDRRWSTLAIHVALGKGFPQISENYSEILRNNPKSFRLWNDESKMLNSQQQKAIQRALNNRFSLIQGPPGTGKSIVGAHLAYTFAMGNRQSRKFPGCVIYCGPSNKAVDVVHDYFLILNKSSMDTLRILRLYGRTHERLDFKDPISELKIDYSEDTEGKCKERFQNDSLHWKVRQMKNKIVETMESKFKDLLQNDEIPSIEEREELKKTTDGLEKEVLHGPYDIILCTCNETCSRRVLSHLKIAQCIVDECGMAHEPETLAAISLAEHAVLIGDHMQLQPVVKYQPARQCGLTTSLFERYAEMDQKFAVLTKLNIQYRMHCKICEVPSEMYYERKLIVDKSIEKRKPLTKSLTSFWQRGSDFPIMFCDVVGKEIDNRNSAVFKGSVDLHSKSNFEEASKTLEIIKCLVEKHHLNDTDCDIAVLTPYAAQKVLVRELLKKSGNPRIQKVVVSSIIESQGDEYNIVILNTVRSLPLDDIVDHRFVQPDSRWMRDNLGFLTDPHQINVGLTRARHGLIIIGNKVLLNYEKDWRRVTKRYTEYECVVAGGSHSFTL